jgi:hypothetical protein
MYVSSLKLTQVEASELSLNVLSVTYDTQFKNERSNSVDSFIHPSIHP